jgi:methionyl-tRNA formyltransferase
MKIIILKGQDPRHNFFAKSIITTNNIESMVFTHKREDKQRLKKMLLKSPKTFFNRVSKYIFYSIIKWSSREREFFGHNPIADEIVVNNYNDQSTIKMICDFKPDLIAVFGTPIIANEILDIPKYGAINLHGGISPDYKGGNTIFWALYNNDLEKVGATIHYMVEKVDSGDILAKVYPDLNSNDDEFTASAKTFKYSTEKFIKIIQWIQKNQQRPKGEIQSSRGKLYLAKDRTLLKEIQGIKKIKKSLQNINLKKRVERFYA